MAVEMVWPEGTLCHCLHSRELIQNPLGRAQGSQHLVEEAPDLQCSLAAGSHLLTSGRNMLAHLSYGNSSSKRAAISAVTSVSSVCRTTRQSTFRASNSFFRTVQEFCKWADKPRGRWLICSTWFPHNFVSGSSYVSSLFTCDNSYHIAGSKIPEFPLPLVLTLLISQMLRKDSCHNKHSTFNSTSEHVFSSNILYCLYRWTCLGKRYIKHIF